MIDMFQRFKLDITFATEAAIKCLIVAEVVAGLRDSEVFAR